MSYVIERVEWKDYGDIACDILARSFPGVPVTRYAWLHEHNPAGPGALWLARTEDGRPVGTAAVHGRRIVVDGRPYLAGLATNFAVEPGARAFGPALALQRAVLTACTSGEFAFLYGFPNRAAKAVFERIGYQPGTTLRLARPLRTRPYLARSGRMAAAARFLAWPLDLALRLVSLETYHPTPRGTRLEPVEVFDQSFDVFWTRVRERHEVIAERDSEYMNWRYAHWPTRRYGLAVLRRGSEICGTVVWYQIEDIAYVSEMFALDAASFDTLLVEFLRAQRRTGGVCAVSLILLGDLGVAARLGKYGFFVREVDRSMMVYVPSRSPLRGVLDRVDRWYLFEGDIL